MNFFMSKLLGAAWVPSPDRAQVLALLQGWGPAGLGPSVSLEGARAALRDALAAPALSGSLSDPAIRVVTPMGLLGGAFDLVVVTGLTEGRLPRRPGEDPVLPDGLLEQLNRALGTCLATSRELAAFEYRRFAAIVSSCTGRLWLSSPATQLLEGRPLLPSTLLLETASVLLGRRARFRDLEDVQVRCGSRARPWPDDAARAVGALEHRVAATALDRRAGLARLARHSTARRLLGLHRALDASAPTPWTGTLAPGILPVPGLDGTPLPPAKLAKLIADPGAFLVDEVLGVHRLAALYGSSNLAQTQFQDERLREAFEAALDAGLPTLEAVATAWQAEIDAWRRHRVDVRDGEIAVVRAITLDRARALLAAGTLPDGARRAIVGPVSDDLPWVVTAEPRVRDTEVGELRVWRVSKGKVARDATDLVLAAMALPGTRAIRVATLDGVSRVGDLTTEAGVVRAWLERATHRATVGSWPWGERGDLTLGGEPVVDTKGAEP